MGFSPPVSRGPYASAQICSGIKGNECRIAGRGESGGARGQCLNYTLAPGAPQEVQCNAPFFVFSTTSVESGPQVSIGLFDATNMSTNASPLMPTPAPSQYWIAIQSKLTGNNGTVPTGSCW